MRTKKQAICQTEILDKRKELKLNNNDYFLNMIELANQSGSIKNLKQLITLRNDELNRVAKMSFIQAMSKLQSEIPEIKKNAQGYQSRYASLDYLIEKTKKIIANNDLYFRFNVVTKNDRQSVDCVITHKLGYSQTSSIDIKRINSVKQLNAMQINAVEISYAKRYVFSNAFGIVAIGDDTDGYINLENSINSNKKIIDAINEKINERIKKGKNSKNEAEKNILRQEILQLKNELKEVINVK